MAVVELDRATLVLHDVTVLDAIDLRVADGELLVLLGPSGAGKSSLLRLVAGLDHPTSGHVYIGGDDVTEVAAAKRRVAMVFQDNALFPFMDVRSNVAFPLELKGDSKAEVEARVSAETRVLAIQHLLDRMPRELSAGHQQLVQAAKALVRVPEVFLMDEPLARLDPHLRLLMRREFKLLQSGYGVTTIYVTNDQEEAMAMADRLAVIVDGQLEQIGAPLDLYERPATTTVASLVGNPPMSLVPGRVAADPPGFWIEAGSLRLRAWEPTLERATGATVTVGIRPEHVLLDDGGVSATVAGGENLGSHGYAWLELDPDRRIQMRTDGVPPRAGSEVSVSLRRAHVFDGAGRLLGMADAGVA